MKAWAWPAWAASCGAAKTALSTCSGHDARVDDRAPRVWQPLNETHHQRDARGDAWGVSMSA